MEPFSFDKLPEVIRQLFEKVENIETILAKLEPPGEIADKMLSVQEAAAFLNTSVQAVYTMVSRKEITVHKPSRRLFFDRADLIEWIRSGRCKTSAELQKAAGQHLRSARRKY